MPDLGKATYTLVFDTREGEVAIAGMEKRADAAGRKIAASMGKAERSVSTLGGTTQTAANEVEVATGEMATGFTGAGDAAEGMAGKVSAASTETAAASEAAAAKTSAAWSTAGKRMETIGKRMKHIGSGMMHKITLPTAIIGGVAIKEALDYNEKIHLLQTQAGATGEEMEKMNKQVLKLADTGKVTHGPNALADALYHLESVGLRGKDALKALAQADHLATIGNASLEDSTNILATAWKTGIKGGENFSEAIGTINASIGTGNLRMPDFIAAMQTGLPDAAKFAGLSLRDVGSALATLTSRGIPAVKGATFLKMALLSLKRPTEQQAKALDILGVKGLKGAEMLRKQGLIPTIDLLKTQYLKMVRAVGKEKADAVFLKAFGGVKSGQGMLALIQGSKTLRTNWQHVGEQAKHTGALVREAMDTPINKLRRNMAQLQAAGIRLGNALIPALVRIAHAIVRAVTWFQKLSPHMKRIIIISIGIAAALGPIISILGSMIALGPALAAAFAFLLGWPGMILAVVGALIYLYKRFAWFRTMVTNLIFAVKMAWKGLVGLIASAAIIVAITSIIKAIRAMAAMEAFATGVTIGLRGALLSLSGIGLVAVAAAAGFYYLAKAAGAARAEIDALNSVATVPKQELMMYNIRVRANMAKGMTREQAKKLAVKQVNEAAKREKGAGWVPFKSSTQFGQAAVDKAKMPKVPKFKEPKVPEYKPPKMPNIPLGDLSKLDASGGVKGGGAKSSPWGPLGEVWFHMQEKLNTAKATKSLADDKRALTAEDTFLRKILADHRASAKKKRAALAALKSVDSQLRSLIKKSKPKKDTSLMDELTIAKAKASLSGSAADRTRAKAAQHRLMQQELHIINIEMQSLRQRLKNKKLSLHQQARLYSMLAALDRKKAALWKKMHPKAAMSSKDYGDTGAYQSAELAKAKAEANNDRAGQIAALQRERAVIMKWLNEKKRTLKQQIDAWNELSSLNSEISDLQQQNADEEQQQLDDAKQTLEDQRASIAAIQDLRGSFFSQFAGNIFGVTGAGLTLSNNPMGSQVDVTQNNHYNEIPKDRFAESRRMRNAVEGAFG